MSEILGQEPLKFASTQTAVDMARSAYKQAAHLSAFGIPILGVSCTCALATDRIKKGDHKVRLPYKPSLRMYNDLLRGSEDISEPSMQYFLIKSFATFRK